MVDGEMYFVGKDVADALGYVNDSKAIRDHIDEEDKRLGSNSLPQKESDKQPSSTNQDSTHSSSHRNWKAPEDSSDGSPAKSFWRRFNELLMYLSIQHKASWPRGEYEAQEGPQKKRIEPQRACVHRGVKIARHEKDTTSGTMSAGGRLV